MKKKSPKKLKNVDLKSLKELLSDKFPEMNDGEIAVELSEIYENIELKHLIGVVRWQWLKNMGKLL